MRVHLIAALALAMAAGCAAQTPLEFEVASVKIAPPLDFAAIAQGRGRIGVKMNAGRIDIASLSLRDIILVSYKIKDYQLVCPDWLKTVRIDISAKLPEGAQESQVPEMLQTLLVQRFGLQSHKDSKDLPVFHLVEAKGGAKLKEAVPDPDNPLPPPSEVKTSGLGMLSQMGNMKMSGDPTKGMTISGLPQGGKMKVTVANGGINFESSALTMAALSEQLNQYLDRPVLDKTGLPGRYEVALTVSMEDMRTFMAKANLPGMPAGAALPGGDSAGSSILDSLQRLGLKLEKQKAAMEMIVVDQMAKTPTEN